MTLEPWQQSHVNRYELRQLVHSHLKRSVKPITPSAYRRDDFPQVARLITDRPEVHEAIRKKVLKVRRNIWKEVGKVAALIEEQGDESAARKMRRCHDPQAGWLHFCPTDASHHMAYVPERCWQRICPSCAKAIAERLRLRYAGRITKVMLSPVSAWTLKMLTLTAKREDDLAAQIAKIHKATKKLIRHFWTVKDKRAGAFATFEIGPKGGNVHVHCIVYGRYVSQEEISTYWRKLTGNPVVDIRRIDPSRAVTEGIKYITKFAKGEEGDWVLAAEDLVTLHFALKGKRRAWSWGAFYGIGDEDEEEGEDDETTRLKCPKCGAMLASETLAGLHSLLNLKREIKCSVQEHSQPPPDARHAPPSAQGSLNPRLTVHFDNPLSD